MVLAMSLASGNTGENTAALLDQLNYGGLLFTEVRPAIPISLDCSLDSQQELSHYADHGILGMTYLSA